MNHRCFSEFFFWRIFRKEKEARDIISEDSFFFSPIKKEEKQEQVNSVCV